MFFRKKQQVPAAGIGRATNPATGQQSGTQDEDVPELERPATSEELDSLFSQVLEDLAIPEKSRADLLQQDDDRKWKMILANKQLLQNKRLRQSSNVHPRFWVELVGSRGLDGRPAILPTQVSQLLAVLRTGHKHFLAEFIESDGVSSLLGLVREFGGRSPRSAQDAQTIAQLVACFKALMNNNAGMDGVLATPGALSMLASCMALRQLCVTVDSPEPLALSTSRDVITLLAVTCFYSASGREIVVKAMDDLRVSWGERLRFQTLVQAFETCKDLEFRKDAITFFTTVVNSAASVESRVAVRNDLMALDIVAVMERVCTEAGNEETEVASGDIATQFQVFEDMAVADHGEVMHSLLSDDGRNEDDVEEECKLDLSSMPAVLEALKQNVESAGEQESFLHVLQGLLIVPSERRLAKPVWDTLVHLVKETTTFSSGRRPSKPLRLDYSILRELLSERQELDKKIAELAASDAVIEKQRVNIESLQMELGNLKSTIQADEAARTENVTLKKELTSQSNEIAALKKRIFSMQTGMGASVGAKVKAGEVSGAACTTAAAVSSMPKVSEDPTYAKFFKMLKMRVPRGAVENKMRAAGLDPSVLDDPDAPALGSNNAAAVVDVTAAAVSSAPKISDDPIYAKFFKMLKMKVPRGAVENKMRAAGLDPCVLDNPDAPASGVESSTTNGPKVSDDPSYAKFFKMLKMKVPRGAVENKMRAAGLDPSVLDNPDGPVPGDNGGVSGSAGLPISPQFSKGLPSLPQTPVAPAGPKKKDIKPNVKMRGVFWNKLQPAQLDGTMWPELSDDGIELDIVLLEKQFGKADDKGGKKQSAGKAKSKAPTVVHLIDSKRQQNVGIGLARFRSAKGPEGVKNAVLKMDDALLDLEHTQALIKLAPTSDEAASLKGYEGSLDKLGTEDRFLLELCKVPRLLVRLKSVALRHTFDGTLHAVRSKTKVLREACVEIKESTKLKKLLEVILKVGNYVNGSTPRGAAWGFKLDALAKFDTVRANDGKHTLMHYVAQLLEAKYPDLLTLGLPKAETALEVSYDEVTSDLRSADNAVKLTKREVEAEHPDKLDRFVDVMEPFEVRARKEVDEAKTQLELVEEDFKSLSKRFADSTKGKLDPAAFFGKIVRFRNSVLNAHQSIVEERHRAERAAKAAAEKAKRDALRKAKNAQKNSEGGVFEAFKAANTGNADEIVNGLRSRFRQGSEFGPGAVQSELAMALSRRKGPSKSSSLAK